MKGFDGKVAIVTGGGSGLGEAIAKSFAARGVKVVVSYINLKGAERVAQEISFVTSGYYLVDGGYTTV